jgi:anti-sigma regulatory factor (Ser/Thr protein kinase)
MRPDTEQETRPHSRTGIRSQRVPEQAFNCSYPAVAESVRRVRNASVEFARRAGATEQVEEAIRLAASEAAANVVEHAYPQAQGQIDVTAEADDDSVWLIVADDGTGLTFGNRRPGLGLGFIWMAWFSDGMTLASSPAGGLEVTLRFGLN